MRLFVALELPAETKSQLGIMCCGVPGARWLDPDQLHLTLRFIGEVDGDCSLDITEALAEIQAPEFALAIKGVGCFSSRDKPRVLWAGVENNPALARLQKKIEGVLVRDVGLKPEGRKYSPHITLARLQQTTAANVAGFLAEWALFQAPQFSVEGFALISSTLSRSGAKYRVEERYPTSVT